VTDDVTTEPAAWTDPHLQPAAKHPTTVEGVIIGLFFASFVCFALFGAAYWQNWAPWTLGVTLGAGMTIIGIGITAWGKYLMPRGPFVEERHVLASAPEEVEAFTNAIVERGAEPVRRRKLLGATLGAGMGVFSIVALFPLLRSMGPKPVDSAAKGVSPSDSLKVTDWTAGTYLVDYFGRRVKASDIGVGSTLTVFPEGLENTDNGQAVDQTFLVHALDVSIPNMDNVPDGFVAYSKVCTHAGCPVGLYERQLNLLVCPCHQSMFNVVDKANVVFGPAPRPLPQLPIAIDSNGYLYATAGYDQPIGPGFWERG
jgi:ubiquinol-cytochrome c reductase iron-sulfur subunit